MAPHTHIVRARFEPAVGRVLLAYDALSTAVTDDMYDNLAKTAPGPEFFNIADNYDTASITKGGP